MSQTSKIFRTSNTSSRLRMWVRTEGTTLRSASQRISRFCSQTFISSMLLLDNLTPNFHQTTSCSPIWEDSLRFLFSSSSTIRCRCLTSNTNNRMRPRTRSRCRNTMPKARRPRGLNENPKLKVPRTAKKKQTKKLLENATDRRVHGLKKKIYCYASWQFWIEK